MYLEMAPVLHLYNVFRNRWCGAYWASQGLRVVPTVNWGDETTFDFCFAGIEKGSVVAVSTYMASAHDNRCDQKEWFLTGYREMLRRIEPEKIICYHTPFPEMEGNIVYVDYERSSWRYLNTRQAFSKENPDSEDFRFQGFFSVGTLSYAWGKLYRSQFLNQNKLYFEEVSYAEDKLFNMKCYLNNPKYAFLPDAVYVYRKNDQSVSFRYRANSRECWLTIAYKLRDFFRKYMSADERKKYQGLIYYLLFFACFFDAKMEYVQNRHSLRDVVKLLKAYQTNPLVNETFVRLTHNFYTGKLSSRFWKIMIKGFCIAMRLHLYYGLAIGIKLLIDIRVDERLSDTGLRE